MKRFEYTVRTDNSDENSLNNMGKNGWELVCVIQHRYGRVDYYWKRALPESNDKTETK